MRSVDYDIKYSRTIALSKNCKTRVRKNAMEAKALEGGKSKCR